MSTVQPVRVRTVVKKLPREIAKWPKVAKAGGYTAFGSCQIHKIYLL